ncbi:5'-3'-deoxyribonucleotidase [Paenibacillus chartarius]|uniref:5'-3'-deoxyribonucleotidase n=1 Tax=Paenibacillus chartarius TaxID=747481 RepID=A0ABV6DNL1_9BACL
MKQRIAVDMDEVIADFMSKYLRQYNEKYEDSVTPEQLQGKKLRHIAKCGDEVYELLKHPEFFADLGLKEHSQDVLRELQERYDIYITTAAMEVPNSFNAKYRWLKEHFPFIPDMNIVFCGDKSIIRADYLIDDNSRHFQGFMGKGILFTAPHNVFETGYTRVDDWLQVRELFANGNV